MTKDQLPQEIRSIFQGPCKRISVRYWTSYDYQGCRHVLVEITEQVTTREIKAICEGPLVSLDITRDGFYAHFCLD